MSCNCKHSEHAAFDAEKAFRNLAFRQDQLARLMQTMTASSTRASRSLSLAPGATAEDSGPTLDHASRVALRIVGGTPTPGFPECCLVGRQNPNGTISWSCTGVLVHPRIVLTAGHCLNPNRPVNIVALNASNMAQLDDAEIATSRRAVRHPLYVQTQRIHDITVMILHRDAETQPVDIAGAAAMAAASHVELVGFGNSNRESTRGFGIKRRVSVDMVSIRRNATQNLDADEIKFDFESDVEFVAGGEGFDSCNGDSGGPAYLLEGEARQVAGLTSRGIINTANPCGDGGVYTRLDHNLDFIRQVAQQADITL